VSLFVAIRPDEAATDHLADALETRRRLPVAQALRWQPPSQWHITLSFLGDAPEQVADDVAERLAGECGAAVPGVRLRGSGCFGRQILWLGIGDDAAATALADLARSIPNHVRGLGLDVDRRPWRGHLTVARARHGDARPVADLLADYDGPPWRATELLVIRSTGGPRPAHLVVHTLPLDSAA
jgi:RNA 2',3'-cyclic 3'-phosphodiesterase